MFTSFMSEPILFCCSFEICLFFSEFFLFQTFDFPGSGRLKSVCPLSNQANLISTFFRSIWPFAFWLLDVSSNDSSSTVSSLKDSSTDELSRDGLSRRTFIQEIQFSTNNNLAVCIVCIVKFYLTQHI